METKLDAHIISNILSDVMPGVNCEEFIREYLRAVDEVTTDGSLSLEDKLIKLLSPLLNMTHEDNPEFDKHVQVVDEDYIDLKSEVDTENLSYDDEKYDIQHPINTGNQWLLETGVPAISLSDKYSDYLAFCRDIKPINEADFDDIYKGVQERTIVENKKWRDIPAAVTDPISRLTINEVHELWLPSLTEESIKIRDLLQQILVCYTIKKAQNGDERSVSKLFALFEKKVRNNRTVRIIQQLLSGRLHLDLKGGTFYHDDIIQTACNYLWLILHGFRPRQIIDSLMKQNEKYYVPHRMKEFYLGYFSEEVPNRLHEAFNQLSQQEKVLALCRNELHRTENSLGTQSDMAEKMKQLKELGKRLGYAIFDSKLTVDVLLNPYDPIMDGYWKDNKGKVCKFNEYCYRPNKKGNLTVWLFGPKGKPEYGKLYQLVCDEFETEIKKSNMTISANDTERSKRPDKPSYEDGPEEPLIDTLKSGQGGKEIVKSVEDSDLIKKGFDLLVQTGFSERDIDIFRERILYEASADEIEQKYGIGTRQQQKILKKIEEALRRSMNRL